MLASNSRKAKTGNEYRENFRSFDLDQASVACGSLVEALMTRAREADRAGDQAACEQALAEVERVFFQ